MADAQDNKEDDKQPSGHSMADHTYGNSLEHEHEGGEDHDHDHFEFDDDGPIEQNPIWLQDHVTLVSVGIDIGSSGTQVIFSRINLRRYGEDLTSRYYVVSRETLYRPRPRQDHRRRLCGRGSASRQYRHRRRDPDRRGVAA